MVSSHSSSWPRVKPTFFSREASSEDLPWRCGAGFSSEQLRAALCPPIFFREKRARRPLRGGAGRGQLGEDLGTSMSHMAQKSMSAQVSRLSLKELRNACRPAVFFIVLAGFNPTVVCSVESTLMSGAPSGRDFLATSPARRRERDHPGDASSLDSVKDFFFFFFFEFRSAGALRWPPRPGGPPPGPPGARVAPCVRAPACVPLGVWHTLCAPACVPLGACPWVRAPGCVPQGACPWGARAA